MAALSTALREQLKQGRLAIVEQYLRALGRQRAHDAETHPLSRTGDERNATAEIE